MKCAHLFNGIGGFALAAHWMGWENVMHCEIDSFCNRVMNYHFPKSVQHEDIKTTDFTIWRGRINLLTGGFPCQPYSTAGKRLGKDDDRHLWPEMLRAIREISPRWVVGENVRGLVNWNGGMVFDEVQSDLETEGYEVTPFLLPAAGVGAPHRRDRIWFIAHSKSNDATGESRCNNKGWQNSEGFGTRLRDESGGDVPKRTITNAYSDVHTERLADGENKEKTAGSKGQNKQQSEREENRQWFWTESGADSKERFSSHPFEFGQQKPGQPQRPLRTEKNPTGKASWSFDASRWPTQSPVCGGDDGLPEQLDSISFLDWYEGALKALGNAIVPQVALQIFEAIEVYEATLKRKHR